MGNEALFLRRGRIAIKRRKFLRWRSWIFLILFLGLAAAGVARFLGGSLFSLERFEISGTTRTRTEDILATLKPWRGRNLVMLDLAPLAERLQRLAWTGRVTLEKRFPDGLSVRIVERQAIALWKNGATLWWVDSRGAPIALYDPRVDRADYVVLSGEAQALADAVGLLEDLRRREPEYFAALSEIDALSGGDFDMMDSIFRRPLRVLRLDAVEKIDALLKARGLIESRGWEARAIDLRFADRIILEGAYGAGHSL